MGSQIAWVRWSACLLTTILLIRPFASPAGPILLEEIDADPTLWMDGADASTITTSLGAVSNWSNKGAAGGAFTATGAAQPTHVSGAGVTPTGKNVVRFGGNDEMDTTILMRDNGATPGIITATEYTSFVVFKTISTTGTSASAYPNPAVIADSLYGGWGLHLRGTNTETSSPQTQNYQFSSTAPTTTVIALNINLTNFHINTGVFDAALAANDQFGKTLVNGVTSVSNSTTANTIHSGTFNNNNTPQLGKSAAGTFFTGDIAEIIIYEEALSSDDRAIVEAYLYDKWFNVPEPGALSVLVVGALFLGHHRRA